MTTSLDGVLRLQHLGAIRVQGDEAAKFLHAQLTQDFALLPAGHARLAALCSAKGRMQASFIAFAIGPGDFLLVCSLDLLAATLKRLSMFVLRTKAKLTDASAEFSLYGLAGPTMLAAAGGATVPWTAQAHADGHLVTLYPADDQPRGLLVLPAGSAAPSGPALHQDLWAWSEIRSGVATLTAPLAEAFVPQMLNYESIGGVNFKKGCYPGQEVVARSQFRGTLKRRAYVVRSDAPLQPGQGVFHESDAEQPAGTVVQAAPSPDGGFEAIASLQVAAASAGRLAAGTAGGPQLSLLPLPYLLLADV
jgi:folate-binding protein YgfZ